MTVTSVEVPNSESHSGAEKKRNSSEGSIEAYPYANEDTNETIEGKILHSTYSKKLFYTLFAHDCSGSDVQIIILH